ncbi:MAG: xanthine phosphoribosyltransferase [Tissierellia bacterium]|nr:xanthine phosphoribosyltransferase [Tissierellia bacterium]
MRELEELILKKGKVLDGDILKVDSFLNHQVDVHIMKLIGKEFANHFKDKKIDKVLTVESSGIAPAMFTAMELDCDMIFARKKKSLTIEDNIYKSTVYSYTKQEMKEIMVSKEFLHEGENVLLIDDFLANGQAAQAMIALCTQAGANVCGIGIVIEKSFQKGRKILEDQGIDVLSLARIKVLSTSGIEFVEE